MFSSNDPSLKGRGSRWCGAIARPREPTARWTDAVGMKLRSVALDGVRNVSEVVAAERLVAAITAQRDGDVTPGLARDVLRRNGTTNRQTARRRRSTIGSSTSSRLRLNQLRMMLGAEMCGGRTRGFELVVSRLTKSYRRRHDTDRCASAMADTTSPESIPPDRNAPSGTSLSSRSVTRSSSIRSIDARAAPSSPSNVSNVGMSQYAARVDSTVAKAEPVSGLELADVPIHRARRQEISERQVVLEPD